MEFFLLLTKSSLDVMYYNFALSLLHHTWEELKVETLLQLWSVAQGVDSSYHIWTNVSVRRGIVWEISIPSST